MTTAATETKSTIIPGLRYEDAPSAIEWLRNVLGFETKAVYAGPNGTIDHAELTLGGGMIMLASHKHDEYGRGFKAPRELGGFETRSVYVVVPDADAVYSRAQAAGATIVRAMRNTEYGSREFGIKDPEGHTWTVGHLRSLGETELNSAITAEAGNNVLGKRGVFESWANQCDDLNAYVALRGSQIWIVKARFGRSRGSVRRNDVTAEIKQSSIF